ncbi:F-actin-capping protein subunit beta [Malassezia caprae]|uniref:F-actin-capping protein subunit beta n=1 Tax=Malassezia caprae TaxID=1381934 RepID=A0AAF0IUG1_9BASI|nr:F-actin-capping protein subunit beta [Malassezia caprae]
MSAEGLDPVALSLDILRRLPPAHVKKNLNTIAKVLPNDADDLMSNVDQPLTLQIDSSTEGAGREYLCCDYNRDGQSWRSWYSNTYNPPLEGGSEPIVPVGALRELELQANDAFETYLKLYYDTGYTNLDGPMDSEASGTLGTWESIHVFEIETKETTAGAQTARYKLSSSVMLTLKRRDRATVGHVDLSGSLTRQIEETLPVAGATGHVVNLGRLIEDVESRVRNQLQEIYFGKMVDVVDQLRSTENLEASRNAKKLQEELVAGWER